MFLTKLLSGNINLENVEIETAKFVGTRVRFGERVFVVCAGLGDFLGAGP